MQGVSLLTKNDKYKKIITHGGEFHADEVSAIALLRVLGVDAPIERKFQITPEELDDTSILIIDIGKIYDRISNFDHHQDSNLESSNILTAIWLENNGLLSQQVYTKLFELLFSRISKVDLGVVKPLSYEFSSLIKSCTSFEEALSLAVQVIGNIIRNIKKSILDEERYNALSKIGRVAVQEDTDVILGWKDLAFDTEICFLVCPNVRGGWNLISRDSDLYCIPAKSNQTFRHNTGFMAVYETMEEAIEDGNSFIEMP